MSKTVIVTGGSRGIGAAVARKAIGKYNVAIFYNNSEESAKALYICLDEPLQGSKEL